MSTVKGLLIGVILTVAHMKAGQAYLKADHHHAGPDHKYLLRKPYIPIPNPELPKPTQKCGSH